MAQRLMPAHALLQLRSRLRKVCVPVAAATPEDLIARARALVVEQPFLEFRLDALDAPGAAIPLIREFIAGHPEAVVIATCRRKAAAGGFRGSAHDEIALLAEAAEAGCHIVDLSLETVEALTHEHRIRQVDALRGHGAALLISYHDPKTTRSLEAIFHRIERHAPDFIKIVSTARRLAHNLAMLRLLVRYSDRANMVAICMGERGLPSRVLGPRTGSIFTFAAASEEEATAPGQLSASALRDIYRLDQIDGSTRVYAVAGNPIRQSLSPLMLNAAFRKESVNAVLLPLRTATPSAADPAREPVTDLLKVVREIPLHGLSVTMPLKRSIIPYLEKTDPLSGKIGACNTVVRSQEGKLYGFNTDVAGIVYPLEKRLRLKGANVLVLGAGGAARAAVFGLVDRGATVSVLNRTAETAHRLARQSGARVQRRDQLRKQKFDVIVNATSLGMRGHAPGPALEPEELNARLVYELVYNPIETPLVRLARSKGIPVIPGLEMFVHQGARQFEIWTGKPAPETDMLRVVLHALRHGAASS
jgi:3-dehydroquinate dehydratase/shikimate dehydrogenase